MSHDVIGSSSISKMVICCDSHLYEIKYPSLEFLKSQNYSTLKTIKYLRQKSETIKLSVDGVNATDNSIWNKEKNQPLEHLSVFLCSAFEKLPGFQSWSAGLKMPVLWEKYCVCEI